MKRIGLISDTHGYLDSRVKDYFKEVDEIWHAGDIGSLEIIETLESWKPCRMVFGNIDDAQIRQRCPEDNIFEIERLKIWMTHIAGIPPKYNPRIKKMLAEIQPNIIVCGHSHILRVISDPVRKGLIYLNPGAAGNQGFHKIKTLLRFSIDNGSIKDMQAIELGKRGALDTDRTAL